MSGSDYTIEETLDEQARNIVGNTYEVIKDGLLDKGFTFKVTSHFHGKFVCINKYNTKGKLIETNEMNSDYLLDTKIFKDITQRWNTLTIGFSNLTDKQYKIVDKMVEVMAKHLAKQGIDVEETTWDSGVI